MPPSALLLEGIHDAADVRLQSDHIDVRRAPRLSDATPDVLKETMAMGIRSRTNLDAQTLRQLPALSAVGCFCIGTKLKLHLGRQIQAGSNSATFGGVGRG